MTIYDHKGLSKSEILKNNKIIKYCWEDDSKFN